MNRMEDSLISIAIFVLSILLWLLAIYLLVHE